ncbi:MAG TPA: DoxX family protein [Stellaceae bacterium]|nr:DoxX family protein [Stellaceae bacterium]
MSESSEPTPLILPFLKPLYTSTSDLVDLLFRLLVGLVFVPHGYAKLFVGTDNFIKFFGNLGLNPPGAFVYFIGSLEFFGGLAIAFGFLTRPLALMLFVNMTVAAIMVHLPKGWSGPGGAEYVVVLAVISLVLAARGSGRISVDRLLIGREF